MQENSPLRSLRESFRSMLNHKQDDVWATDFVASCFLGSRLEPDLELPWGVLVGPPSSAKTESLLPFAGLSHDLVCPVDDMTPKALNSGFRTPDGEDPSLLIRLNNKIMLWPEFGTMIGKDQKEAAAIMGLLRRAFDGQTVTASTGVGTKSLQSRFGFLGASTGVIDDFLIDTGGLGDRFVLFRMGRSLRTRKRTRALGLHVIDMARKSSKGIHRDGLRKLVIRHFSKYQTRLTDYDPPEFPKTLQLQVIDLSDLVSRARAIPKHRPGSPLVTEENIPRFLQQLINIATARILLDRRHSWTDDDLKFASRIAVDTIPLEGLRLLAFLARRSKPATSAELARDCARSPERAQAVLRQYQATGLVEGLPLDRWTFTEHLQTLWDECSINRVLPPGLRKESKHG